MTKTEANQTVDWDDLVSQADGADRSELCFVVMFHPDTRRIGEIATWAGTAAKAAGMADTDAELEFGRHEPVFSSLGQTPSDPQPVGLAAPALISSDATAPRKAVGLDDKFISRQAFSVRRSANGWRIARHPGRSRIQVNGRELAADVTLSDAQLESGVVLALARRVILHCRLRRQSPGPLLPVPEFAALDHLLGVSPAMQQLKQEILSIAAAPDDVLLVGATGTGKERVAEAIHRLSSRAQGPWVPVNMAAIPVELAAATLFGARRGAYTGADSNRRGYFQQAAGGTLFLDEVGDTPELVQPLLLRALQERELQVVGGALEPVDLRVVSATERDPAEEALNFRASLRQRLAAQEICLPLLRERAEDTGLLAAAEFRALAARDGTAWDLSLATDLEVQRWARCFEMLAAYHWPGNVRELQHAVAQIHHASGPALVLPAALARRLRESDSEPRAGSLDTGATAHAGASAEQSSDTGAGINTEKGTESLTSIKNDSDAPPGRVEEAPGKRLADFSDSEFLRAWELANYEVASLARALGVSRAAVYRRLSITRGCRLARDVPLEELTAMLEECRGDLHDTAQRLAVSTRGLESRLRSSGMHPTRAGSSVYRMSG